MGKKRAGKPITPGPQAMSCLTCEKVFSSGAALQQHQRATHMLGGDTASRGPQRPSTLTFGARQRPREGFDTLRGRLQRSDLGTTEDGQNWALRCLHPNGENAGGSWAIPDTTSLQVALPECKTEVVIPACKQIDGTPLASDATWDLVMLVPDVPEVALVIYSKPSTASWADVRTNLNSATPTCTPPSLSYYSLFSTTTLRTDADKWRTTFRGATCYLNANFIQNQGFVYADNWPVEYRAWPGATTGGFPFMQCDSPLIDGPSMIQRSDRCYQSNAYNGTYVVMYPEQASVAVPYHDESEMVNSRVIFQYPDETGTLSSDRDVLAAYAGLRTRLHVSSRGGFTNGFIVFNGLSSSANIVVKLRQGLEIVPTNATIAQAFTRRPPMLDRKALDAVARVAQTANGAYPKDYNDLSKILGDVWGAIKGVIAPIGDIAGLAAGSGIPVISDVGGVIRDISGLFR